MLDSLTNDDRIGHPYLANQRALLMLRFVLTTVLLIVLVLVLLGHIPRGF